MMSRLAWLLILVSGAFLVASCSSTPRAETATLAGSLTGQVEFGGNGNHDGLVNAMGCNEDKDVDEYYKVTTYTTLTGEAGDLGSVTVEMAHCNSDAGPVSGQAALMTDNGDVLYADYDGLYGAGTNGEDQVVLTFAPQTTQSQCYLLGSDDSTDSCRSTGQFESATGTATMLVTASQTDADPFIPWTADATWENGTVTTE